MIWVQSLGQEDTLEEGMAIPSSILAWRILWTEVRGGLGESFFFPRRSKQEEQDKSRCLPQAMPLRLSGHQSCPGLCWDEGRIRQEEPKVLGPSASTASGQPQAAW